MVMNTHPQRVDPNLHASLSASHEDMLAEHMEAVRLAVEQSLQTICHQMHQVAHESTRLARSHLEQLRRENEKMRSMEGTGDSPQLNSLRGNAWVTPIQPVRPQAYDEMRINLPAEGAPLIEIPGTPVTIPIGFGLDHDAVTPNNKELRFRSVDISAMDEVFLDDVDQMTSRDSLTSTPRMEQKAFVEAAPNKKGVFDMPEEAKKSGRLASGGRKTMRAPRQSILGGESGGPRSCFADASAMKEKVRAALTEEEYNVTDFYHETGVCQSIARSQAFEYITLSIIAFNALWISIDTDHNDSLTLKDAEPPFIIAENAFCVYFTFEWVVRFAAFAAKKNCLHDSWFCFDTVLVIIMIAETWVMNAILLLTHDGSGSSASLGNTSVLKLFRLVRLTRMARMAKLLRAIPELIILIKGIAVASRSVAFTLILLCVILYFFAIVFRQLTDGTELGDARFESVGGSMSYLLLDGVLPDQAPIIRASFSEHWLLGILMLFFILLATLTVMNMLVGVLCEVVSVVSAVEKEELTVNYVKMRLMHLFRGPENVDCHSMTINKEEFSSLLAETRDAALIIREIGVDVVGLVDYADFIFEDQKELDFGSFMELVLSLRGTNTSTVKDIIDLRKTILTTMKKEFKTLEDICRTTQSRVSSSQTRKAILGDGIGANGENDQQMTFGRIESMPMSNGDGPITPTPKKKKSSLVQVNGVPKETSRTSSRPSSSGGTIPPEQPRSRISDSVAQTYHPSSPATKSKSSPVAHLNEQNWFSIYPCM